MLTFDDLTWTGGLVFDDLDAGAVSATLQQADAAITLTAEATHEVIEVYDQLFEPELTLTADAAQEFLNPAAAVAYLQQSNARLLPFAAAGQEHIAVAAGELGQVGNVVLVFSVDAYQQYIEGTNPGESLQQATALVGLTANALQVWEAAPIEPPELALYTQISDAQLLLTANGLHEFVVGSNYRTTVAELLEEICFDELSDMFIGNRTSIEEVRPKLLPLLNTAMTYAYARWEGVYSSTVLSVVEGQKTYQLRNADILQITQVINVYGIELPQSEYRVIGQTIQFHSPQTQDVEVLFKAKHVRYTLAQNDAAVKVALPDMLMPWLKAYVCYRYFASMKTEGALLKAADFLSQANMHENMFVQTNTTNEFTAPNNEKMAARGFM